MSKHLEGTWTSIIPYLIKLPIKIRALGYYDIAQLVKIKIYSRLAIYAYVSTQHTRGVFHVRNDMLGFLPGSDEGMARVQRSQKALKQIAPKGAFGIDNVGRVCDELDKKLDSATTYSSLLQQCIERSALLEGKHVHEHIRRSGCEGDTFLGNLLIKMYGKCGNVENAAAVFDKIHQRNVYSWTMIIAAYAHNGYCMDALELFRKMQLEGVKPNRVTFVSAAVACSVLVQGLWIHRLITLGGYETDVVVVAALISMYSKCGSLDNAREVFINSPSKNVFCWTAMVGACVQYGHNRAALEIYSRMEPEGVKPNKITFVTVLGACSSVEVLQKGKLIHEQITEAGDDADVVVGTAIVNMYGKCGCLDEARNAFNGIHGRNVVSWNAMITAYAQQGHGWEALELYHQMEPEGIQPNRVTFLAALDACATIGALVHGKQIHARVMSGGLDSHIMVGNTLVNMYGKCGSLLDARNEFERMTRRSPVSWNAMLAAYAQNGYICETFQLFQKMDPEGMKPDKVSFVNVLFACSHAGLLDEGWRYFISMREGYGITPTLDHYGCILDLLGRVGRLEEAGELLNTMPFEPSVVMWLSLLGAYRMHGVEEQGACLAEYVAELDPENSAPYILISNMSSQVNVYYGIHCQEAGRG